MLKRLLSHSAVYLTIGAIITVAISWAIAAWMPLRPSFERTCFPFLQDPSLAATIHEYQGFGWNRRHWDITSVFGEPINFPLLGDCVYTESIKTRISDMQGSLWKSNWGSLRSSDLIDRKTPRQGWEHATGWPLPALWYEFHTSWTFDAPPVTTIRGGIPLSLAALSSSTLAEAHALPLQPIWLGLLANSALWGALGYALFIGGFRLRRSLRLSRNHCPHCNYDLSASPTTCPECGWITPAS